MIFRAAFFLLILLNLVFFSWAHGYWGAYESGREPQRLDQQMNADKLRILPNAAPDEKPALSAAAVTVAADTSAVARGAEKGSENVATSALTCRIIGGLTESSAATLKQAFDAAGWSPRLSLSAEPYFFLVLIPELPNQAAAEKKAGELERRGVMQFRLVAYPNQRHEIHLGGFDDEPSARTFLGGLNQKGVTSPRIERRPNPARVNVELTGPRADVDAKLPTLLAAHPEATHTLCATQP